MTMDAVEKLNALLPEIEPEKYGGLPDIELYMDQLIEYLSRRPMSLKPDGRLTGAMVNNYIKSGLLPRARGKRYSKEHLADLAMIVRLKQVLSVADTGALLSMGQADGDAQTCYDHFCGAVHRQLESVSEQVREYDGDVRALAMELALESYVKKVACEYLIGTLTGEEK